MASKLSIILIFVGLAQSSLVSKKAGTCAGTPEMKPILETIRFAESTETLGYVRFAEVIFAEISAVMGDKLGGGDVDPERADMRAQIAQNGSLIGPMNAVVPNCDSLRIVQPDIDIMACRQSMYTGRLNLNQEIFQAIKAAQGDDLQKAKDEIAQHLESAKELGSSGIQRFYSSITNGSKPIPDDAQSTIACMQSGTETMKDVGLEAIFEEISILAEALHGGDDSKDKIKDHLRDILMSHTKAGSGFRTAIDLKFQVARNVALQQYFDRVGTLTGLFALESTVS